MFRPRRVPVLLALALLAAAPAAAMSPGSVLLAVNATSGVADFVSESGGFLSQYDHGEIGVAGEGWCFLDKDVALTAGGGIGRFRERQRNAAGAEHVYSQHSWNVRLGVDRVIEFRQNGLLYFGPGAEYWRGWARLVGFDPAHPAAQSVTPAVNRWSVSARFGGIMVLSSSLALNGRIGYHLGYATASDAGARTTWFPSGWDAAAGLMFALGK